MTDSNSDLLPQGIWDAIDKAAELNNSTALNEQKSHPQLLREGMFKAAANYADSYKQHHPEAAGLMTRIETLAYKPKPAGYPQFIDAIVDSWLTGTVDAEPNTATVQRIRDRFPNHRFASNVLNKPLSKFMLFRLAALATAKGLTLNTRQHDTLAKIKAAARKGELCKAKAGSGTISINVPFSPSHLGQFKIEKHGQQDTVRFRRPDGTRRRIAIADVLALAELFADAAPEDGLLSTLKSIGNRDQNPANPQKTVDPVLTDATDPENIPVIWDQSTDPQPEPTLTERIAALRANIPADHAPAHPPEYDPLCDL